MNKALKMIEEGVMNIYDSDKFKEYLIFLSKFHNYSFNNVILILSQCPHASLVAGYKFWQNKLNLQVKKGEKAIKILAPCIIKVKDDNEEEDITYFKFVNVFDISQTMGEEIPTIIDDLKGNSNAAERLIESLLLISDINIEFINKEDDDILSNGAKGYYNPHQDKIIIDTKLDNIQKCKTLVHEYVHGVLHKDSDKTHNQREIEAEALAFIICHHFNIDTSEYSFAYIASYANQDYNLFKDILNNISNYAHEFIMNIEPLYLKLN